MLIGTTCTFARRRRLDRGPGAEERELALAGHDKQRIHLETVEIRSQTLDIVVFLDVDNLLGAGDYIDGHVIVAPIAQDNQPTVDALQH